MNDYARRNIPFLFILDFELNQPIVIPFDVAAEQGIYFNIKGFCNYSAATQLPKLINWRTQPMPFDQYEKAFCYVKQQLNYGNSFLVNLTFPTKVETNLTLRQIFEYSHAPYKLWYKDQFVVFSPEPFVHIEHGQIASFPMKGTIDAALPDAATMILQDAKERAEHHTIVDLIRNDLNQVASHVRVEQFRYLDYIKTLDKMLLQVSSKIVGDLEASAMQHLGELFAQLLPAGSISGAPKQQTLKIIRQAEQYERGYYTGVFGYFLEGKVESAVMIRFIENINSEMYFKSGGGITVNSNVEKEYQELLQKVYVPVASHQEKQFTTAKTSMASYGG